MSEKPTERITPESLQAAIDPKGGPKETKMPEPTATEPQVWSGNVMERSLRGEPDAVAEMEKKYGPDWKKEVEDQIMEMHQTTGAVGENPKGYTNNVT
jgi:hypothetical protein